MPFDNPHYAPIGDLEILMDARSRIAKQNMWVKGSFRDGDRHCLVAALFVACGSRSLAIPNRKERRLARMLANQLPSRAPFRTIIRLIPSRQRLMWFNDGPRTCHEDVIALFDRAIDHLTTEVQRYVSA
jgi:hypothetical protein